MRAFINLSDNRLHVWTNGLQPSVRRYRKIQKQTCVNKLIKYPECSDVIELKNWIDPECEMARTKGTARRSSERLPSRDHQEAENDTTAISACTYCKDPLVATHLSPHEKKCIKRPIKCPECSDIVFLRDWYAHECQTAREGDGSLSQDLKKMLSDGKNHDLILKVGDKELRAHQDILRSRSRVFESMLDHDMKEKNSGVITVPDCDPEAMQLFLFYVYTGKVETLDETNMLELYYIADKYDMQGLKKVCIDYVKKSLSHTNICDVIQLALKHSDADLLENATEYFNNNVVDVMRTVEWQIFLKDNTTVGNELLIKSFEKLKK